MLKFLRNYVFVVPLILFFILSERYLLRDFWFDEALTFLNFVLLPLKKIYFNYAIPNNHIGYTILLHIWYNAIPQTVQIDVWCRLLSFVFAGVFIIFSWMKFKRFVFRTMLCCFAVSVPFVIYATSVRGYMMSLLFVMIAVHCACRFAYESSLKNAVVFFLASLCCVSVLPSNLFALGAVVIYTVPFYDTAFYRKKSFYQLAGIALMAFFVFWMPLLPQLIKASQLGEGWHDRVGSLVAGGVSFAACVLLPLLFALFSCFLPYRNHKVRYLRTAALLVLLPLLFLGKVAPFPRVYFPFFGIFMLIVSGFASRAVAFVRSKKICRWKYVKFSFFVLSLILTLGLNYFSSPVKLLSGINGSSHQDDYFAPWYCERTHVPRHAANILAKQEFPLCYLSFSSDPWSVMFYSALNQIDMNKFCFDGPRGRVNALPDGALAVINKSEQVQTLTERFRGVFTEIGKTPMHRIYRYSL